MYMILYTTMPNICACKYEIDPQTKRDRILLFSFNMVGFTFCCPLHIYPALISILTGQSKTPLYGPKIPNMV